MDGFEIEGGFPLSGTIRVSGAKNAALPALATALLTSEPLKFSNFPLLGDTRYFLKILEELGAKTSLDENCHSVSVQAGKTICTTATYELVRKMRASILVLGPLLARFGEAIVSKPGGCAIGQRPIDLHLNSAEKFGAKVVEEHGYVRVTGKNLMGAKIYFPRITVTGTMNALFMGVLAKGSSLLQNAAQEPEVAFICRLLNKMGAKISNIGGSELMVEGVASLGGAEMEIIPDRIEAGTLVTAALITGGQLTVEGCIPGDFRATTDLLESAGARFLVHENSVEVFESGRLSAVNFHTAEFPGIATDMQAQLMALFSLAKGTTHIRETIFENRFMHASELWRMGANIEIHGNEAIVTGVEALSGAKVMATDLRASASLVIAALSAQGVSHVARVYHIDRGYEKIDERLRTVGAKIKRIQLSAMD
jgi:UDP-N-acetylglucosamine 1-carboxyvinyltransferase